jgi:hypothetical protein
MLQDWLDAKSIDIASSLIVTFGTTGFNVKKDTIFSISLAYVDEPPETFYIQFPLSDTDVSEVFSYTGVSQKEFLKKARFYNEVIEEISPIIQDAEFIFTYAGDSFYRKWVSGIGPILKEKPYLDIISLFKLKDRNGVLRHDIDTIEELQDSIYAQVSFMEAGYSLDAVFNRYSVLTEQELKLPRLETRALKLQRLLDYIL